LIAPIVSQAGQSYNQNLTVNYQGRTPLVKNIAFTVKAKAPDTAALSLTQTSVALAAKGVARTITIQSSGNAINVSYIVSSALPEGTTITPATCGDITNGQTCVLTVTPGEHPSSAAGEMANPSVIKVQGLNTNEVDFKVSVVTLGNIFQQGYIFALDDTTPVTGNVGGSIASLSDSHNGIQWYNGEDITTGANSVTDGIANTIAINNAQGQGNYAASYCANYQIDSAGHTPCQNENVCYKNWYLPAICEMGPDTNLSGCVLETPNMFENLIKQGIGGFSTTDNYWSSTEFPTNPNAFAWYQFFGVGQGAETSFHAAANKYLNLFDVRCARAMTH
jgi:hypothetical protein